MLIRPLPLLLALFAALTLFISGCTTVDVARPPSFENNAAWAILPFANHTETPQAGLRAEAIADSLLRSGTGLRLKRYPAKLNTESLFEPMDRNQSESALEWARAQGVKYAIRGTVDEWRYKVGVDGEPAAGLTLEIIDVRSGDILWTAAGGKTGWSREALSAVAQKLTRQLLAPVLVAVR